MSVITIETRKLPDGQFELTRTDTVGYWNLSETVETIIAPDRMIAAIENLGKACKYLSDNEVLEGTIAIAKDEINRGEFNGGEHNELFNCVSKLYYDPFNEFEVIEYEQNRKKYIAIYGDYIKWLDRIIKYMKYWKTTVTLVDLREWNEEDTI